MSNCMIDHDYFRALQNVIGATDESSLRRLERQRQWADEFDESFSYEKALRNDVPQDFIFKSTQEDNQFMVYTRPDEEINIGDILYWNGMHWLVRVKDFNTAVYNSATIVCCNRQIKWQNPDTREIITRWCFAAKPYTSNVEEGNVVTLLHGRYDIELPYDEETIAVPVGKRFLLDVIGGHPMCYKLVFPDVNTNKFQDSVGGFIEWTLESDEFQKDNDRVDLMVCNYLEPEPEDPETDLNRSVIIGRDELKIGGLRQYTAKIYSQDETELPVEGYALSWELVCSDTVRQYVHIESDGASCRLSCDMQEFLMGTDITLTLDCHDESTQNSEITIKVVSAFG